MGPTKPSPGLFLLFPKGRRPNRTRMLVTLAALPRVMVTHDPGKPPTSTVHDEGDVDNWLELMADGLTFDLLGLAPGPGLAVPEIAHRFNCAADIGRDTVDAIGLMPGPHIADGAETLPVVRTLVGLAAALAEDLDEATALLWLPARSAIARSFFIRTAGNWLGGGVFPALGLVAFAARDDGGLRTEGLSFFIGQELDLAPALAADRVAATRIAARLVHELVSLGRLAHPLELVIEEGVRLLLDPGENRLIRVRSM